MESMLDRRQAPPLYTMSRSSTIGFSATLCAVCAALIFTALTKWREVSEAKLHPVTSITSRSWSGGYFPDVNITAIAAMDPSAAALDECKMDTGAVTMYFPGAYFLQTLKWKRINGKGNGSHAYTFYASVIELPFRFAFNSDDPAGGMYLAIRPPLLDGQQCFDARTNEPKECPPKASSVYMPLSLTGNCEVGGDLTNIYLMTNSTHDVRPEQFDNIAFHCPGDGSYSTCFTVSGYFSSIFPDGVMVPANDLNQPGGGESILSFSSHASISTQGVTTRRLFLKEINSARIAGLTYSGIHNYVMIAEGQETVYTSMLMVTPFGAFASWATIAHVFITPIFFLFTFLPTVPMHFRFGPWKNKYTMAIYRFANRQHESSIAETSMAAI